MTDLRPNSEIADGVHWLSDSYVNLYIIESGEDLLMIDSGLNKKAKVPMKYIKTELEERRVSKIYLTHHHADHMGGLHYLYEHYHPRNFAHEIDAQVITGERKIPYPNNKLMWPIFFIVKPFMMPKRVKGIELVKDGDIVDEMTVHHLPGHTMGSVGYQKGRTIFEGDSFDTFEGAGKLFTENRAAAIESLRKLSTMDFDILLGGHHKPILGDAKMRVLDYMEKQGIEPSDS